jgi:hypothetical protein
MPIEHQTRPKCRVCGESIGAYEPLWRAHPRIGAEPTSWLQLATAPPSPLESLRHADCAETDGIEGG